MMDISPFQPDIMEHPSEPWVCDRVNHLIVDSGPIRELIVNTHTVIFQGGSGQKVDTTEVSCVLERVRVLPPHRTISWPPRPKDVKMLTLGMALLPGSDVLGKEDFKCAISRWRSGDSNAQNRLGAFTGYLKLHAGGISQ